jgi:ATP:corrinoid adenosyltransferase
MGERKVLNFAISPDFDPARMPKGKRMERGRMEVRMMLPMSVQCTTCGTYMYRGKKFNSKKEDVVGEEYLGMKAFRFIFKCVECSAPWSIKTDYKNTDYIVEYGVTRNFEPWRQNVADQEASKEARKKEAEADAMRALEHRTLDSRRQMEIMDALDEIKTLKARQSRMTADDVLSYIKNKPQQDEGVTTSAPLEDDDEEEAALDLADLQEVQRVFHRTALGEKRLKPAVDADVDNSSRSAPSGVSADAAARAARLRHLADDDDDGDDVSTQHAGGRASVESRSQHPQSTAPSSAMRSSVSTDNDSHADGSAVASKAGIVDSAPVTAGRQQAFDSKKMFVPRLGKPKAVLSNPALQATAPANEGAEQQMLQQKSGAPPTAATITAPAPENVVSTNATAVRSLVGYDSDSGSSDAANP